MAKAVEKLHQFTALREDYVSPAGERENQSELTEPDERQKQLDGKELLLKQIQTQLEHRQSQFESDCKSRDTKLAERERQLNEKEAALHKLQQQLEERENQLKKRKGESEADEEHPPPKKRKIDDQQVSLLDT